MKTNFIFTGMLLSIIIFSTCRESALSDIELTDPSILKVYGVVWKYSNLDSIVTEVDAITFRIKDKTDHSIQLKKWKILCNNIELEYHKDLAGPIYRMPENQTEIKENTSYDFIVELADGKQYSASIYVDDKYPKFFESPVSWTWTETDSLLVSWNELADDYNTTISWYIIFKDGVDTSGKSSTGIVNISDNNYYAFPSSFFTNSSGVNIVNTLYVTLTSVKEGEYDDNFYKGRITGRFEFRKKTKINE